MREHKRMRRLRRTPALLGGLAGMAALAVLAIVAEPIWGAQAEELTGATHLSASAEHWFGTDALGRDVFARTMVATRLTLLMSLAAAAVASMAGIAFGAAIWLAGPRVRELGQRLVDVLVSYPSVIFALVVAAVLGPGPVTSVAAIGLATAPAFARLTTNLMASVSGRDFVTTARLLGVSPLRLIRRHLLPNVAEPLLILVSVAFTVSLKALSGLSFLGLGVQAPDYDWGALLAKGLEGIYINPAPALGPSAAIVIAGLAGGLIGDGLAAAMNPREPARGARAQVKAALAATSPVAEDSLVVVDGLRVSLPDGTRLVDDVSFTVAPGEIVGVVGESGSGKSLTAMALAQLLPDGLSADSARLRVGDLDLSGQGRPDRKRLATEIGIVYQDPSSSFNPTLRLGAQLTETLRVHGDVSRAESERLAVEQLRLARVTLPEERMRQYPHQLSGGMRQRAMIASALLTRPRLLIADEPTTALDVTVQAEVLRVLKEANERDAVAMLVISHDIGVISAVCDRVLVMYSGRIVEELPIEQLREGRAHHPYTRALLAATPSVHGSPDEPLATIPGRPPAPARRPAGCAFADRCALVEDRCRTERPVLSPVGEGSAAACHVTVGSLR